MKKLFYPFAFALTAFLFVYSCSTDEDDAPPPAAIEKKYTLAVTAGEGGTVSSSGGTYSQGTQVSITATPSSGFTFSQWSDGSTTNPITVTLNSNTNLSATFTAIINRYTLTVTAGEGGTVSTEGGTYDEGTEVTITATPEEGYEFVGWEEFENNSSEINLIIDSNISVQAIFQWKEIYFDESITPQYPDINYSSSSIITNKYSSIRTFIAPYIFEKFDIADGCPAFGEKWRLDNYCETRYKLESNSAIFFDYDSDGKLDLFGHLRNYSIYYLPGPGKNILVNDVFGKNPDIRYFDSDVIYGEIYELNDFNGDGTMDILSFHQEDHGNGKEVPEDENGIRNWEEAYYGYPIPIKIFFFYPDGSFTTKNVGPPTGGHAITSFDIDNDGDIDIVNFEGLIGGKYMYGENRIDKQYFYINDGNGNFEIKRENFIQGDYFQEVKHNWSWSAVGSFDLNNDSYIDLILAHNTNGNGEYNTVEDEKLIHKGVRILWGNSNSTFSIENSSYVDFPKEKFKGYAKGTGFIDYNNDGFYDIVISDILDSKNEKIRILKNDGNENFIDVTNQIINNDPEIVQHLLGSEWYDSNLKSDGNFIPPFDNSHISIIDVDGDGDFDIKPYGIVNDSFQNHNEINVFWTRNLKNIYYENNNGIFSLKIERINHIVRPY